MGCSLQAGFSIQMSDPETGLRADVGQGNYKQFQQLGKSKYTNQRCSKGITTRIITMIN